MSYEVAYGAVACASIFGSGIVGLFLPGPWALLGLLFLIPIAVAVLLIRRKLIRE